MNRSLAGFCFVLLTTSGIAQAQATRVTDINSTQTGPAAFFSTTWLELLQHQIVAFGNRVAFTADDGIHGVELWVSDGTAPGTLLVADLCPGRCPSFPTALAVLEDQIFFSADDGVHGAEPFVSDGSTAGTVPLGDLWPGNGTSRIRSAIASSTQVFFDAETPDQGREVWRTDGTVEGTRLVRDLFPGPESARAFFLGTVGGTVLFSATDGLGKFALWRSNGTAASTAVVPATTFDPSFNSIQAPLSTAGQVFYIDYGSNQEVWRSDGTEAGTFPLTDFPPDGGPHSLAAWNGRAYFIEDRSAAIELWASDGTVTGTSRVAALPTDLWVSDLLAGGNGVYFRGCDTDHGCELWYSDGSELGTHRVHDLRATESGLEVFRPLLAGVPGGLVYFADEGVHGSEPWFSDGTEAGTERLADLTPGPGSSHGMWDAYRGWTRATAAGRAFFWASSPGAGFELWSSDGTTAGTRPTRDVNAMASSFLRSPPEGLFDSTNLSVPSGVVLFATDHDVDVEHADPGTSGLELWQVPHGAGPPVALGDLVPGPTWLTLRPLIPTPGGGLFRRDRELWRTDGTVAGTQPVASTVGFGIEDLARLEDRLLVTTASGASGYDLRALSLDLASLSAPLLGAPGPQPDSLQTLGTFAFLFAGAGLAVSDGTTSGTRVVTSNFANRNAWAFTPLATDRAIFSGSTSEEGVEPWVFDLAKESPSILGDLNPGAGHSLFPGYPRLESFQYWRFAPIGGTVLFGADDGIHGFELWASDGTAPGTRLVADLRPGAPPSDLDLLVAVGSRAYFLADDGVLGRELWVSDGTAAGTRIVRDLAPGPGSAVPQALTAIGDFLVFSAWTPEHGRELWISDGTELGTRQLVDVAPGPASSSPIQFFAAGGWLYFVANDNTTGDELWRLPLGLLQGGTIFSDGFESGDESAWSLGGP